MQKLILLKTPLHDLAILAIIFLSMSYLILLIPEWNAVLTMGTLIGYYIILNIKNRSGNGSDAIPVEQVSPECDSSRDPAGAGEIPKVSIKLISVALAMIILLGIAWTFYPGAREQPLDIQPGGQTYEDPGMPSDPETPVVTENPSFTETTVPEITPTGNRTFISLDRYRILRGVSPVMKVGDEVVWVNEGKYPITVVSDDIPGFTEQLLGVGKRSMPYMFTSPGTYNYYLKNNKNVNGTIKVKKIYG